MYLTLLKRELSLQLATLGEALAAPALYLLAVSLFMLSQPYGIGVSENVAAAALWVCALMALGLTQYRIWERDARDGTLEQWALLPIAFEGVVIIKLAAHWLMAGLPLLLVLPVLGELLGVALPAFLPLLLGTLALTALGSVAGAVSLRFASRQLLTLLLVFPLSAPVLIFGAAASLPQSDGSALELLLAYVLTICPLAVAATGWLLRIDLRG